MRVGEAAERIGTSARMLRYAEQLGLVAPARTAGGYREYGPEVAGSLRRLIRLRRGPDPVAALDFETAKARRLLRLAS
jgi:DNA-binding transcriptional MerR regulator